MKLIRYCVFLWCFLLVGCATTQLSQPLPKNEAIGVSSQMNAYPNISFIGTTVFTNKPEGSDKAFGMNVQRLMESYLYSQLQSFGYSSVSRIDQSLLTHDAPNKSVIQQVMQAHHLNTLVVILPGGTNFIEGGVDSMLNPYGYGVFKRSVAMFKAAFVYGSYDIKVYQAPDAKVIASQSRFLKQKITIKPWTSSTSSLTAAERKDVKDFVQQQLLPSMKQDTLAVLKLSS